MRMILLQFEEDVNVKKIFTYRKISISVKSFDDPSKFEFFYVR